MLINKLLAGMDCTCGRHHCCDIKHVFIGKGAISHLKELVRDASVLLVADENTLTKRPCSSEHGR